MSKGLVLLVDDYQGQRDVETDIIERHGFTVEAFSSASSLLGRYRQLCEEHTPPVAIVSDNNINGSISGIALAREIRLLDKELPFLLISNKDVGAEFTHPLSIEFMKKDTLFDSRLPKAERNRLGLALDRMIASRSTAAALQP